MPSSTPASRARAQRINAYLKYSIVMGIGILVGFSVFLVLWKDACYTKLQSHSTKTSVSQSKLEEQHEQLQRDWRDCQAQSEKSHELHLQSLQAHSEVTEEFQTVTAQFQATQSILRETQETSEKRLLEIQRLKQESQKSTSEVTQTTHDYERQIQTLTEQTKALRLALQQQNNDQDSTEAIELANLQKALAEQCLGGLTSEFGSEAPVMELKLTGVDSPIWIELNMGMPVTVHTLVQLASDGFYTGTAVQAKDNEINTGSPRDAVDWRTESNLQRQYHEYGMQTRALLVQEVSPRHACQAWSVGMPEFGPGFTIFKAPAHQDGSLSCPGKVIQGREILQDLQGKVYVESTRVFLPSEDAEDSESDDDDDESNDEL